MFDCSINFTFNLSRVVNRFSLFNEHRNNKSSQRFSRKCSSFLAEASGKIIFCNLKKKEENIKKATANNEREIVWRRNNQKIGKLEKEIKFPLWRMRKKGTFVNLRKIWNFRRWTKTWTVEIYLQLEWISHD